MWTNVRKVYTALRPRCDPGLDDVELTIIPCFNSITILAKYWQIKCIQFIVYQRFSWIIVRIWIPVVTRCFLGNRRHRVSQETMSGMFISRVEQTSKWAIIAWRLFQCWGCLDTSRQNDSVHGYLDNTYKNDSVHIYFHLHVHTLD